MISFKQTGDFSKLLQFFGRTKNALNAIDFDRYGKEGVAALASATPVDSSLTAHSWSYSITKRAESVSIEFFNSNVNHGVPIAIILQYGHGTGTGGYVQGRDYINPALRSLFDRMANDAWKEVTRV